MDLRRKQPLVWAHRGASGYETDNTLEAFDLAVSQGADGIESDIRVSRDGVPFLFHDDYLPLEYGGVRPEALSMSELQAINLTHRVGIVRKIPTLEEVLLRYREASNRDGKPILFSLDVIPTTVAVPLAELSQRVGMTMRTVITPSDPSSAFYTVVRAIRRDHPTIPIVRTTGRSFPERLLRLLPDRPAGFNWPSMRRYGIAGLNFRAGHVSTAMITRIQDRGYLAWVWDCHDEEPMRRFVRCGADALYTNYPDRLRGVIDEH